MPYFSRLTDIVTCNLSKILASESDPTRALDEIISEMRDGVNGANRSLATARRNEERVSNELVEHEAEVERWAQSARDSLAAGDESGAREALLRKKEHSDLVAGLERELREARATTQHLTTTLRALEARLADARRKQTDLDDGVVPAADQNEPASAPASDDTTNDPRKDEIEAELAALRKELEQAP